MDQKYEQLETEVTNLREETCSLLKAVAEHKWVFYLAASLHVFICFWWEYLHLFSFNHTMLCLCLWLSSECWDADTTWQLPVLIKIWIISEDALPQKISHWASHVACLLGLPATSFVKTSEDKHASSKSRPDAMIMRIRTHKINEVHKIMVEDSGYIVVQNQNTDVLNPQDHGCRHSVTVLHVVIHRIGTQRLQKCTGSWLQML